MYGKKFWVGGTKVTYQGNFLTAAIQTIAANGPNTNMIGNSGMSDKLFDYLSLRWFFYGSGDGYNPSGPGGNF